MSKRRRLASAALHEEKKTVAPPRRVFPPPECVIVSQAELQKLSGSRLILFEIGLMDRDYAHLLDDEINFVILQTYDGISVTFEDKNGKKRHINRWSLATNIALFRLAGRQRYQKAVIQSLCVGLHSPNSSIHRAFNSALGETNLFRCILDF